MRIAIAVLVLAATLVAVSVAEQHEIESTGIQTTYWQLYPTPDGETHFREVNVLLAESQPAPPAPPYAESAPQPATTIRFAAFPAHWGVSDRDRDVFHNATGRRFISVLRGIAWIKASDGVIRQLKAGDILEVLDVAPSKGHITWVGDQPYVVLFSDHP